MTTPATPAAPRSVALAGATAPTPAPTAGTTAPMTGMTNINTATGPELDKLPGIGKARLAKIIANRPYKATDELVSKKVIPKNVFDKIKDKITVDPIAGILRRPRRRGGVPPPFRAADCVKRREGRR